MPLNDLISDKLNRISSVPDAFVSQVSKEQMTIYKSIINRLDLLERKNGIIAVTQANLKIASEIFTFLLKVLTSGVYKKFVTAFINEFDVQAVINDKILSQTLDNVTKSDVSKLILEQYKAIATDSLISSSTLTSVLAGPIKTEIEKAVLSGLSIAELTENIRAITLGNADQLGRLERYASQIAYDGIATTDRAYTKSISEENDIEFFRYAGGLVRDSRDFCISKDNKQYHIKEIENWGNLSDWQGRIKGTNSSNIFTNLGGYRCEHSLVPISLARVKKEVLKRNLSNGNLKLNQTQKDLLGI